MMKKLERNSFVKHLGVMIDNNLSWKFHVDYIALSYFVPTSIPLIFIAL